jgi:hypothetical protein
MYGSVAAVINGKNMTFARDGHSENIQPMSMWQSFDRQGGFGVDAFVIIIQHLIPEQILHKQSNDTDGEYYG